MSKQHKHFVYILFAIILVVALYRFVDIHDLFMTVTRPNLPDAELPEPNLNPYAKEKPVIPVYGPHGPIWPSGTNIY